MGLTGDISTSAAESAVGAKTVQELGGVVGRDLMRAEGVGFAERINPFDPSGAGAQNLKGDCQSAKEAARKSADLKSRFGGAWYELGIAEWCGGRGNKAGALNAFERARNDRDWRKMAEYEIDKVKNPQKYEK